MKVCLFVYSLFISWNLSILFLSFTLFYAYLNMHILLVLLKIYQMLYEIQY